LSKEYERNPLWLILVEAVQALPMYSAHKAYVRDRMLLQMADATAEEVSLRLDIPLGEAMVILHELGREKPRGIRESISEEDLET
jgi:hypothetical protein